MDAPNKIYVEVCEDGIFAFPEPPFKESVEYIRADLVGQSLQQEEPDKSLEEAADEWYEKCPAPKSTWWDEGEEMKLTDSKETFIAGAKWQKEQMLKDAVEGVVCILPGSVAYVDERDNNTLKQYIINNFKAGDKVKIIIVKED